MNVRRFEHRGKGRFFEVYWDHEGVELISGAIGTKGRAMRPRDGWTIQRTVAAEIEKRLAQGFVEVQLETAASAPCAPAAPDWIARIAEAYDDDAPRLVYADWLQQQGDPLGEFIVLQCERARLDRWNQRRDTAREREEHMLALYRQRWLPDLAAADVVFERGFVERIKLGYPFDLAFVERLLAATPLARTLELSPGTATDFAKVTLDPLDLGRFTGLFFRGLRTTEQQVRRIVEDPMFAHVDRLGFSGCTLGGGDLKALERRAFRELDFSTNALGLRGTQYVLGSQATLVALDLGNAGLGHHGAIAITEAHLPKLERLWLRRNDLSRALPRFAIRGPVGLKVLELAGNPIAAGDLEALGAAKLPALRELDLSACSLTDDMVIAFAASPLIRQLAWLDLGHNAIGHAAAEALAAAELPALRHLDLSGTAVGERAQRVKQAQAQARVVARSGRTS